MKPRFFVAIMLVLVFAAGAAANTAVRKWRSMPADRSPVSWPELVRELRLSSEQERRIDSIFASYQPKTDALILDLIPQLQALSDSMDADILPLLNPAQRDVLSRTKRRPVFMLKRKTPAGERVDTIQLQTRRPR